MPNWPITRLYLSAPDYAAPDRPLGIVSVSGSKRLIMTVNAAAHAGGILPGMRLTDAKAILPSLVSVAADPVADNAALTVLCRWAQRFTPSTSVCAPDGLWLDITGCARLWGGEEALIEALMQQLERRGTPCRAAIADTFGAAWAFARETERYEILPPGAHLDLLPKLPLKTLRLNAETLAGLRRLGLKTIAEVMALPRAALAGRFDDLTELLDQALGDAPEAVPFAYPPTPWFESLTFADFIMTPEDLQRALDRLAAKLCKRLGEAGKGGKRFEARFFGADNSVQRIAIATSLPSRDARALAKLLSGKLEGIDPGFGIEVVTLRAGRVERLAERQISMEHGPVDVTTAIAPLIDRLGNRLGFENIWRFSRAESHLPERSITRVAPLAEPSGKVWEKGWARPIRLLSHPEPIEVTAEMPDHPPRQFLWRRIMRRVRRAEGPERIAPEWWHDPQDGARRNVRDYYRVEDESGARFWVYRDGLYRNDAPPPRWYIHGFLA